MTGFPSESLTVSVTATGLSLTTWGGIPSTVIRLAGPWVPMVTVVVLLLFKRVPIWALVAVSV